MSTLTLVRSQLGFDLRTVVRNPAALFFSIALPIILLVSFMAVYGNGQLEGRSVTSAGYLTPALAAMGVISLTTVNLSITLAVLRENGVLKRLRVTPLSPAAFMASRILATIGVAAALVVALLGIGAAAYGLEVPLDTIPGLVVTLVIGAAAFSALGVALTALIPNDDAAAPIANAVTLPLFFVSGLFFPIDDAPGWMRTLADVFPVHHFAEALIRSLDPAVAAPGVSAGHLAVVAAWGLAGFAVAARTFRWEPRRGR